VFTILSVVAGSVGSLSPGRNIGVAKKKVHWDTVDCSSEDTAAELILSNELREGFIFSDSDATNCDLELMVWNLLFAIQTASGKEIKLSNRGIEKTFRLPESQLAENAVKLLHHCNSQSMTQLADFRAGVLVGLIRRDFFEASRLAYKRQESSGKLRGDEQKARKEDNQPSRKLMLAMLRDESKFAPEKSVKDIQSRVGRKLPKSRSGRTVADWLKEYSPPIETTEWHQRAIKRNSKKQR